MCMKKRINLVIIIMSMSCVSPATIYLCHNRPHLHMKYHGFGLARIRSTACPVAHTSPMGRRDRCPDRRSRGQPATPVECPHCLTIRNSSSTHHMMSTHRPISLPLPLSLSTICNITCSVARAPCDTYVYMLRYVSVYSTDSASARRNHALCKCV